MAAGAAPQLELKSENNETEQTHVTNPNSFKEWLLRKLSQIFKHDNDHDTYLGF